MTNTVNLTQQELHDLCDAINSAAVRFDTLVETRKAPAQTKQMWADYAGSLRELTKKLVDADIIEITRDV